RCSGFDGNRRSIKIIGFDYRLRELEMISTSRERAKTTMIVCNHLLTVGGSGEIAKKASLKLNCFETVRQCDGGNEMVIQIVIIKTSLPYVKSQFLFWPLTTSCVNTLIFRERETKKRLYAWLIIGGKCTIGPHIIGLDIEIITWW